MLTTVVDLQTLAYKGMNGELTEEKNFLPLGLDVRSMCKGLLPLQVIGGW